MVGAAVGAAILVPRIEESKEERAERERTEAAEAAAELRRRLIVEQRPRFGRSRSASVGDVEVAISVDANQRVRAREIRTPVERTRCTRGPRSGDRVPLACTAITSVIPEGEGSRGGLVGYPYRALIHVRSGRYAFCKTSGRPGEGALGELPEVRLPRACGG
jgi:hypothetical protein